MAPSKLPAVRIFKLEDMPDVIKLYDQSQATNPHFVRDENFLSYFIHYPGAEEDSIFVASVNEEITGLAILSITTEKGGFRQGKIIELQAKDVSSANVLIQRCLNYCNSKNVDMIVVVPPPWLEEAMTLKDWLRFETGVMMVKTLSILSLLQSLLSSEKIRNAYAGERIGFKIGDEVIEIKKTSKLAEVSDIANRKPEEITVWVIMSPITFLQIIFGQVNPYIAYLTRRIKVKGVLCALPVLKLLRVMKLSAPIYVSLADMM